MKQSKGKKKSLDVNKEIEISIVNGVEGKCLYINHYRVAGSKPWGGGTVLQNWTVTLKDILDALTEFITIQEL